MYELKTLLPQFDIKLPTCMYPLKGVGIAQEGSTTSTSSGSLPIDASSSSSTAEIEARQKKVLQQLNELKGQLAEIRSTLSLCQKGTKNTSSHQPKKNTPVVAQPPHDIVVNGHPNFIPYALLAIKNAWKDLFNIEVRTFSHSSLTDIGAEAKEFQKQLSEVKVDTSKPKLKVTLIWMNCEHTEMISSPAMYVPIYGEVNIIRYLARVGPLEYRYENSPLCNEIDAVLDICYQLLRCTTAKGKSNLIRSLSNRLQKQKYFGGDILSIADIGVLSSLKRVPSITAKDLTPALNEWRKRADILTLI